MTTMSKKTVSQHLSEAKRDIAAGEKSYRSAANHIAAAQDQGATQRDIAAKVGKSAMWVNDLLQWRKGGFKEDSPFDAGHAKAKAARRRVHHAVQSSTKREDDATADDGAPDKVTLNGKDVDVGLLGRAAQEQIAKALTDDEPEDDVSATNLREFKYACDAYLPKLTVEDVTKAGKYFDPGMFGNNGLWKSKTNKKEAAPSKSTKPGNGGTDIIIQRYLPAPDYRREHIGKLIVTAEDDDDAAAVGHQRRRQRRTRAATTATMN
jgi:hypothetical protein